MEFNALKAKTRAEKKRPFRKQNQGTHTIVENIRSPWLDSMMNHSFVHLLNIKKSC